MSIPLLLKVQDEQPEPAPDEPHGQEFFGGERVFIHGWRNGFNKVEATKLLRGYCGYSLKNAKDLVDQILSDDLVAIQLPSFIDTKVFKEKLRIIGAVIVPKYKHKTYHIVPRAELWVVIASQAKRPTRSFENRKKAIEFARQKFKERAIGELLVHGRNGSVRRSVIHSEG